MIEDIKQTLQAIPGVAQVRTETVIRVKTILKAELTPAERKAARIAIYDAELQLLQRHPEALIDFNLGSNGPWSSHD